MQIYHAWVGALALSALLLGCGGGIRSSSSTSTSTSTGTGSGGTTSAAWNVNSLAAWPTLAAQCISPRTGTDPYTGAVYSDRQGNLLSEQNWLASWTNDTYLWFQDVSFTDPSSYSTAINYFNTLKSSLTTASGKAKDRFHFTLATNVWEADSVAGVNVGYGATVSAISQVPPRQYVVAYTEPGSPATALIPPLARGAQILAIDGVDLVNDSTTAGVATLNAGLFPATVGEAHLFTVQDLGASTTRTVALISANITSAPVQNISTLASGRVSYFLFNDHLATAEPALYNAIALLKSSGVTDVVIDMRYNGGGYLDIAAELAYMVAGPVQTASKTFDLPVFNSKHPTTDPVTGSTIAAVPFHSSTVGFTASPAAGTALPHLDLTRAFILTGSGTCSASEAVINGLTGIGVQVIQIGSTTCGKPYGFYPADNCGTTYFSIQFQGSNQLGFGSYSDGFVPQNGTTTGIAAAAILPGCAVADDYTHALGDPTEARLAAALQYRTNATCPAPSAQARGPNTSLDATEGQVVKSIFRSNQFLRRP